MSIKSQEGSYTLHNFPLGFKNVFFIKKQVLVKKTLFDLQKDFRNPTADFVKHLNYYPVNNI